MSKNTITVLICHRHDLLDFIYISLIFKSFLVFY
jgi:hypothetical protein